MFYSHYNREGDVMVIPFAMGTRQGDPLRKALFTLVRFKALHFIISHFPSSLFPSIASDTHMIKPPSIVLSTYEHFKAEFCVICFSIQP
jgi:hypothetical protein